MKRITVIILLLSLSLVSVAQKKSVKKVPEPISVIPADTRVFEGMRKHQTEPGMENREIDGYRGLWYTVLQRESDYGDKYSGGLATYTAKHRPMAIYSKEADKTFFVYGGTPRKGEKYLLCMVGCYDHKTGMLRKPVVAIDKGCNKVIDCHDNPVISIDKDGYIWVFAAGRGNTRPGIRVRSSKPYDISHFDYVNEGTMAYPQVYYNKDRGFFLFCTRYDGVRRSFFQTSPDGIEWSDYMPVASIVEPGETRSGHYQITAYDGKDKLVSTFNRHIDGACDTRTNIYYIQSTDWGKTWTAADGKTVIDLPVEREQGPALIRDYRSEGRNCYIKDVNFDSKGNPIIYFVTSDNYKCGPEGGIRRHGIAHWTGKKWFFNEEFTTSNHNYDTGSIWVEGKDWYIITTSGTGPQPWGTGGEVQKFKTSNGGRSFRLVANLTEKSPRNHAYVRRPLYNSDDFYAFWADGDPNGVLETSYLYFCNKAGEVFRMPYDMDELWMKPEKLDDIPYRNR
ncbi:MAG: BNR-4 repeat-containing protein [Bacteroidales bacterium]|nr:BNR-4 repeat-containing protein [Bacteroidales bacterium]